MRNLCLGLLAIVVLFITLPATATPSFEIEVWSYFEIVIDAILELFGNERGGSAVEPSSSPASIPQANNECEWGAMIEPNGCPTGVL